MATGDVARHSFRVLSLLMAALVLPACSDSDTAGDRVTANNSHEPAARSLTVYKSPTCGCCGDWIDHMRAARFDMTVIDHDNLNLVKAEFGVERHLQSCHTAVWNDGEFIFEGHIPAQVVQLFLNEKPAGARGLAVPGMPIGSPGMEMGDRFQPYDVLLIRQDGSTETYTSIDNAAAQYR